MAGNPVDVFNNGNHQRDFTCIDDIDMQAAYADVSELVKAIDYKPAMSVEQGMSRFVDRYMGYTRP